MHAEDERGLQHDRIERQRQHEFIRRELAAVLGSAACARAKSSADTASATQIVTDAAAVTALAAAVDLKLVPERLTPGFQHRMPRKSVVLVYLAFAAGLGVAAAASRRASR